MSWTPTYRTVRTSKIADNLLAYFELHQAEAIVWAHGSALKSISHFSNSVANRAVPIFPSIAFVSDAEAQVHVDDMVSAAYSLTFELLVQNQSPALAVTQARSYTAAILSMIRNCPPATAAANTYTDAAVTVLESLETEFAEIRTNDLQNDFLQAVQIRAIYRATAPAY